MKYLILIYHNQDSRELWMQLSAQERNAGLDAYRSLTADLTANGELISSSPLADPSQAKKVSRRDGAPVTTDGPFAEAKEHLAGFYFIDTTGPERAAEYAARIPEAAFCPVQVWPAMDMSAFEA